MKNLQLCLVIDDDQDDQEIFMMCLEKIDGAVDCRLADNGVEAIELLQSQVDYIPNYIFLDVNMPKMNGIECLREIKKIDRLKHTKVFMYSTTSESNVVNESEDLGAAGFIVKPANTGILKEHLAKIFNGGEARN